MRRFLCPDRLASSLICPLVFPIVPLNSLVLVAHTSNRKSCIFLLPVRRLRGLVLKIGRSGRLVGLESASLDVPNVDRGVVQELGTSLLLDGEEAAGQLIEEDAEVVGLVDLAPAASALAVTHERGARLEVLQAGWALHPGDSVAVQDMEVKISGNVEGLSEVGQHRGRR
jgi:hypothetical protein